MRSRLTFAIVLASGLLALSIILLAGSAGAYPPPAILKIDGNEQTSGIGSNCWREEKQTVQTCSDTIGIITPSEPLLARSPFTAHLRMPLQEPPEELGFSTTLVTDDDELKEAANGVRVWSLKYENATNRYKRPLEREPDIYLSLKPGLYVLRVDANWKDNGSVSYGFLVKVYEPEAKITNNVSVERTANVSSVEKTTGFEVFLAITALLSVNIIRRNRG